VGFHCKFGHAAGYLICYAFNNSNGEIMKIPRVTVITLGVADLSKATEFYETVLGIPPNRSNDGITFIELPGAWIALFPLENLAKDISPEVPTTRSGFSGITLAHNANSKDDVIAIIGRAKSAGARVVKEPQETFWGGFSGYFADLDGFYWEVAWGPMFEFTENGEMKFKENA
jgi:catechol 2,3-dioxygenase-like lactoylglutathione lyase family enzyme